MSKGKRRVFSREFKLSAVKRMVAGESAAALSRELQVPSGHLYKWCIHFRSGAPPASRSWMTAITHHGTPVAANVPVTWPRGLVEPPRGCW